jgi:6-phosphogluconolactonase
VKIIIRNSETYYEEAARLFADAADCAVRERGAFDVVLSGGSTPEPLYSLLARDYAQQIDWKKTRVFFADERCVPPDHQDSNFRLAHESLFSKVTIPPENIHRMRGEARPETGANEYSEVLRKVLRLNQGQFPRFDLILLGIGEDCHTASLFPGSDAVDNENDLAVAMHVARLGVYRLTLTPPVLRHARSTMILATGPAKARAVEQAVQGPFDPKQCPAQLARESDGDVVWLLDEDAASQLT